MKGYERLKAVASRMKQEADGGAAPSPEQLTVREFLSWFGYARRGRNKVSRIRHVLAELDLWTVPDFEVTWVDARISIELDPEAVEGITASEAQIDPTVRIGAIEAANRRPTVVSPNSPLSVATTLMQTNDFSQLPVMQNERDVNGIISWPHTGGAAAPWSSTCLQWSSPIWPRPWPYGQRRGQPPQGEPGIPRRHRGRQRHIERRRQSSQASGIATQETHAATEGPVEGRAAG